jgi:hypothetical protein
MQDKPELKIDWATNDAARFACLNWHYAKAVPVGKLVKIGVWENKKFIGCVLFGRGANKNMPKPYGLGQDECVELVRVALTRHVTPVSKIMMWAIKFLKKSNPGIRLVVSYADLDSNHHGGIYQATNWIYEGLFGKDSVSAFIINGKKTHRKSIDSLGVKQSISEVRRCLDPNAQEFRTKGKHKYLMPLDKDMSVKIASLAKPYPKRVKQAMTGDQPEQRRRDTDPPAPNIAENQPFAEVTHEKQETSH